MISQLASSLGFDSPGAAHAPQFPEAPAPNPPSNLDGALTQLTLHGASNDVISFLQKCWSERPLELALASWDLLCTALVDEERAAELARAAKPAWPILPAPGRQAIALDKMSPTALANSVAARRLVKVDENILRAQLAEHSIGAYEELRRRGAVASVRESGAVERTLAFVHRLHLARLETLASFYLHYLWGTWKCAPAFAELCEVLLDCGWYDRLPAQLADDVSLAEYAGARISLANGNVREYHRQNLADQGSRFFRMRPAQVAEENPRLRMAQAAVGLACRDLPFGYPVVDLVADARPDWRFGQRVRAGMHARLKDGREVATLDEYLARFGSDAELWGELFDGDYSSAWCKTLVARASAAVAFGPSSVASWWGLAHVSRFDPAPIEAQLFARIDAQCARVVG